MSAAMIKAHGGSKGVVATGRGGGVVLGGIIQDTTINSPQAVHMKSLERLLSQTTGVPREKPIMDGVITSTVPSHMKTTPELMPNHDTNMSDSKMAVGASLRGDASRWNRQASDPSGEQGLGVYRNLNSSAMCLSAPWNTLAVFITKA